MDTKEKLHNQKEFLAIQYEEIRDMAAMFPDCPNVQKICNKEMDRINDESEEIRRLLEEGSKKNDGQ